MKTDVKSNLHDHSAAKVQLLGGYLKRYLNIISNDGYTEVIHMHDLFCGPGIYENGGEGSPVVALRNIKDTYYSLIAHSPRKKPKINCHFNDINADLITKLDTAIIEKSLHYPEIGSLVLTTKDYKDEVERLKTVFKKFNNEKAFVFIDPYGYKEIKAVDIKDLLDCKNKSEVLLWLPIQFMYRFSDEGMPEVLKNFITQLNVQEEVKQATNVWEFIGVLKDGFQTYLGSNFFVDRFTLKKEDNTVFCLYFFTSHIRGFEKMLEAKWEIDTEQGRGWEYNTAGPNLFSAFKTNELAEKLKEKLKERKLTNGEVYEFCLRLGYLPKHATEILKDWQNNSTIDVVTTDGNVARKGAFYISYDNYKNEPSKVNIKKK